jgi:hypothetical protein
LKILNQVLPTKRQCLSPISNGYRPELDASKELDKDGIKIIQELVGELQWATEMGCVDIMLELSILSSFQASLCQGHLDQVLHIYGYIKHQPQFTLHLDPTRMPV